MKRIDDLAKAYAKTQVVRGKNLPEWDDKTEELIARYYTQGYNQSQLDTGEKKYTEEDIIEVLELGFAYGKEESSLTNSEMLEEFFNKESITTEETYKKLETREETFLRMALEYKKQYDETPWWKFYKRIVLKDSWYSTRECLVKYGK